MMTGMRGLGEGASAPLRQGLKASSASQQYACLLYTLKSQLRMLNLEHPKLQSTIL